MTPKQRQARLDELRAAITALGYAEDRHGNYVRDVERADGVHRYRFKFTKIGLRYEARVDHSDGSRSWVLIGSGYVRDVTVDPETGKLRGLRK